MNTLLSESILSTYCFSHAAIFRRKDCSAKVRTTNWPLSSTDANRLPDLFDEAVDTREQGFVLGGVPYRAIRVDDQSIYGKRDEEALALMEQQQHSSSSSSAVLPHASSHAPSTTTNTNSGAGMMAGAAHAPPIPAGTSSGHQDRGDKAVVEVLRPTSATLNTRSYNGIIICRTHQYFVVGIYDAHPGMAVEAMERLADYFRSKGR